MCLSSKFPRSRCDLDLDPSWLLCLFFSPQDATSTLWAQQCSCIPGGITGPSPRLQTQAAFAKLPNPMNTHPTERWSTKGKYAPTVGLCLWPCTHNVQQVIEHIVSEGCEAPNPACFLDALNLTRIQRLTCEFLILPRSVLLPFWWERARN